jgi:alanine racemase
MGRPLRASIDLSALSHNLDVARHHARDARVLAVIKANAYGHGLLRAAGALRQADGFAVLGLEEAIALRDAGHTQPILLLEGVFDAGELPEVARHRLTPVIHAPHQLDMLAQAGPESPREMFVKINTGMNRLGFSPAELPAVLGRLRTLPAAGQLTLMTHFARADEDDGIAQQLTVFRNCTAGLGLPVSLANSAALLRDPETVGDWVRPGIMLYGASPFPGKTGTQLGLRAAMTLASRLIAVRQLRPGDPVGYGGTFTADRPMRLGVVACGYADGYPRHAGTGTPILVEGARTRTLGRVSMDMLCADITALPQADVGSEVVLWGEGLPAEEVAAAAGTIAYELFTHLGPRVPVVEN